MNKIKIINKNKNLLIISNFQDLFKKLHNKIIKYPIKLT